jgi:glucose/arabinose dehydrogenase
MRGSRNPRKEPPVRPRCTASVITLFCVVLSMALPAGASPTQGLDDPIPGALPTTQFSVSLQTIADGFNSPTSAALAPGIATRLFVTDQTGKIWSVDLTSGQKSLFANLTPILADLGNVVPGTRFDERGLLGLAFDPGYQSDGRVFTYQTEPWERPADFTTEPGERANCRQYDPRFIPHPCQNVLTAWEVRDPTNPDTTIDASSGRELLRIDKPEFNHNAGSLQFGPDGMLYLSVGDGGFGDDQGPGHVPGGNAQSLAPLNVLGKILRIDPNGSNSANGQYGIPADNPFVGARGADETWAYGLRNPYRISFDSVTGQLWTADTGQNNLEEVDVIRRGGNFGWRVQEGTFAFHPGSPASPEDSFVTRGHVPGLVAPVAEYDHTGPHGTINGEAAIGGYVYHGAAVPQLAGRYVFGDYSHEADEGIPSGRLFTLDDSGNAAHRVTIVSVDGADDFPMFVLGFASAASGELYVLANSTGTLAGRTGVLAQVVAG